MSLPFRLALLAPACLATQLTPARLRVTNLQLELEDALIAVTAAAPPGFAWQLELAAPATARACS